jgi:hypothetical protein
MSLDVLLKMLSLAKTAESAAKVMIIVPANSRRTASQPFAEKFK